LNSAARPEPKGSATVMGALGTTVTACAPPATMAAATAKLLIANFMNISNLINTRIFGINSLLADRHPLLPAASTDDFLSAWVKA
jgi:hypothetical protein